MVDRPSILPEWFYNIIDRIDVVFVFLCPFMYGKPLFIAKRFAAIVHTYGESGTALCRLHNRV